jgi:hypothetical protein
VDVDRITETIDYSEKFSLFAFLSMSLVTLPSKYPWKTFHNKVVLLLGSPQLTKSAMRYISEMLWNDGAQVANSSVAWTKPKFGTPMQWYIHEKNQILWKRIEHSLINARHKSLTCILGYSYIGKVPPWLRENCDACFEVTAAFPTVEQLYEAVDTHLHARIPAELAELVQSYANLLTSFLTHEEDPKILDNYTWF